MDRPEFEKLANRFLEIKTIGDICSFFDISYRVLTYFLYRQEEQERYISFEVPKKSGGVRIITSPNYNLKLLQKRLAESISSIYKPKNCVHGFVGNRSIISNAKIHLRKKILVNIDLQDFFGSVNYGRVRGMFMAKPFRFPSDVATVLAQICCHQNKLPQGAPTSPVISNLICRRMDNDMLRLAVKNRLNYSRYADDITFSTNLNSFPSIIGSIKDNKLTLSDQIKDSILSNGFKINEKKIRFAFRHNRQEVTGLIVNKTINVQRKFYNQVHSMIWLWEHYQAPEAARVYASRPDLNWKTRKISPTMFIDHVIGKVEFIGQVIGKGSRKYKKLYGRIKKLEPGAKLSIIQDQLENTNVPLILTEGKTDWKHLYAALKRFKDHGLYTDLNIKFQDYLHDKNMSNSELLKVCQGNTTVNLAGKKLICIFDRDHKNTTLKVTSSNESFKDWGNNVFSLVLPVPAHRNFQNICIEHYYTDKELKTYDENNRRMFTSDEFLADGKHLFDQYLSLSKYNGSRFPKIIDSDVKDSDGESVALSKNNFSKYILEEKINFNNFNIDAFKPLFNTIEQICSIPEKPTAEILSVP